MTITNTHTGTNVHEIARDVFRISTPVPPSVIPGGFTFNQFLIVDDDPLLFHTGNKGTFELVREAVAHVLGARLPRWIAFSHVEADECGALNKWLDLAPDASAVCSQTAAMVSVNDLARRRARALADGEELVLGAHRVRWLDAPHLPHNWETGYLFDATARTLFCGDVLTHLGDQVPAVTEADVLAPALAAHGNNMSGMAVGQTTRAGLDKLARTEATTLALMHGSSFRGDGARVLRDLAGALGV